MPPNYWGYSSRYYVPYSVNKFKSPCDTLVFKGLEQIPNSRNVRLNYNSTSENERLFVETQNHNNQVSLNKKKGYNNYNQLHYQTKAFWCVDK